jgi:hypothetical protein
MTQRAQTAHKLTAPPAPAEFIAFTVRVPRKLVKKLDKDAKAGKRSRTAQVELILDIHYEME